MPIYSFIRLASIFIVAVVFATLPSPIVKLLFVSILFCHYTLSFYYSKVQVKNILSQKATILPLAALIIFTVFYVYSGYYAIVLLPFIGLHIALSETYTLNRPFQGDLPASKTSLAKLNLARFLLNFSIYLLLLNRSPILAGISGMFFHAMIAGAAIFFISTLYTQRSHFTQAHIADYALFESIGVIAGYYLFWQNVPLSPVFFVFYHVVTWLILPTITFMHLKDMAGLKKFWVLNFIFTAFFLGMAKAVQLEAAIPLWASLHFLSSFALSRLNPKFIVQLFYPERSV